MSIADSKKNIRNQSKGLRSRGRPRTGIGRAIGLRLYPELEQKIDAWIADQADHPSRPEAIRRLLAIALRPKEPPTVDPEPEETFSSEAFVRNLRQRT